MKANTVLKKKVSSRIVTPNFISSNFTCIDMFDETGATKNNLIKIQQQNSSTETKMPLAPNIAAEEHSKNNSDNKN